MCPNQAWSCGIDVWYHLKLPNSIEIFFADSSPASSAANDRKIKLWQAGLFLPWSPATNFRGLIMPYQEKRDRIIRESPKISWPKHAAASHSLHVEWLTPSCSRSLPDSVKPNSKSGYLKRGSKCPAGLLKRKQHPNEELHLWESIPHQCHLAWRFQKNNRKTPRHSLEP